MPIINRKIHSSSNTQLKARLIDEWKEQGKVSPHPQIIQEADEDGHIVHVYVVWDDWGDLGQEERSAVITDAFWEVFEEKGLALTVAMGLTASEAAKMGLVLT